MPPPEAAHILVVDDDERDGAYIAAVVVSAGHQVTRAKGGQEALELLTNQHFDLMLLDLLMPPPDGLAVLQQVKANPALAALAVIVITAVQDRDERLRALELGADELLTKPLHHGELLLRLKTQLRLVRNLAELNAAVAQRTEQLTRTAARLEFLVRESPAVIYTTAIGGDEAVTYMSPNIQSVLGYAPQDFLGAAHFRSAGIHPDDLERVALEVQDLPSRGRISVEYRYHQADGGWRWMHDEAHLVRDAQGQPQEVVGCWVDIDARKTQEARIRFLTHHDALTGLPNETLLMDRTEQALVLARRGGVQVALLSINLDTFAPVNETLGLDGSDQVLQQVAARCVQCLRLGDTVARSGGAGFEVLLPDIEDLADVDTAARKLLDALAWPMVVQGHELFLTACIGIAVFPCDGDSFARLSAAASSALAEAKKLGRDQIQHYAPAMSAGASARLGMESALRRALERNELLLHFQPRVDLRSGRLCGGEALLRWQYNGKLVSPVEFIGLAEDTGLILPIGEWVLLETCRQQRAWLDQGLPIVTLAVNVSERQLHPRVASSALPALCSQFLAAMALPAHWLELEVTESLLMQNPDHAITVLRELRDMGIKLAVDDFGTGYSSLAYLKRFPIHYLKIDRSFVSDVTRDPDDAVIARSIISLAHSLRLKVVAEGIETEGQLEYLRRRGCDEMQGNYFSKPLPAEDFAALLRSGRSLVMASDVDEKTLLLLDDERPVLQALARMLRRDGYRILATTDPDEALELLAKHAVQVVISDQLMPKISGTAFLARVRELHPGVVRIVLSGHTAVQTITDAIKLGGIWRFLTKPWDDTLREDVRQAFAEFEHQALQSTVP